MAQTLMDRHADTRGERRLLRLALAKGLLRWEDLDRLEDQDLTQNLSAPSSSEPWPSWQGLRFDPAAGEGPGAPASDLAGDVGFLSGWERYRVERFLGAGGMGAVYRAFDPTLNRPVALKFLHRNDPGQTARFLREARAQARVDHPNVCRVYEVGDLDGRPYIAMQLIEGGNLAAAAAGLPLEKKVELVRDVAWAIHAAHRTGLIHRDLKPGNVLVGTDEGGALRPFVVDFGLARDQEEPDLTRTGLVSGTPAYLSPEQAQGRPLDRRSDVYSLGVVLYELLAGAPPVSGTNPIEILRRVVEEEPRPLRKAALAAPAAPAIPRDLETIAMKCLEKDSERRYESARAVAEDLQRFLEAEPILARPASRAYRLGKRLRKHRALVLVAAVALLAVGLAGTAVLRARWQAMERAALAQRFGQRVKDLEYRMRLEALQPLHDTAPFKAQIRRELSGLQAEMARLGPLAEGPGDAALGRAYLALHQSERAREHLERAWRAGERTPQVAAALGRAVGLAYQKALIDADRYRGVASGTRAERAEIAAAYRGPALSYLKEGLERGADRSPYLAGLIAYYEGRYPEALAAARRAFAEERWFYEARMLEAEIWAAEADEASDAGRYAEAFALNDRAGAVYAGLLAAVRSDASLYTAECARRSRRMEIAIVAGKPWEGEVSGALAQCDRALAVDSDLGEALVAEARILWRRGEQRMRRGEDALADFQKSALLAGRAIRLDPRDALAQRSLATALRLLADRALTRGEDPGPAMARALGAAARLAELQPELAVTHNTLGLTYLTLARDRQRRGIDPRRPIERAAASYARALAINPRYLAAYTNLGNAWKMLAEVQAARGADPAVAVGRAVATLEGAARLNPNSNSIPNNLGNAHLTLAEYQLASGADPRPALERAAASYRRALALNHPYGAFNLAYTERLFALAGIERVERGERGAPGEDPGPRLAAAAGWLAEAVRRNPADWEVYVERGRLAEAAARWAARAGADPGPQLAEAAAAFARAEALNPGEPEVFLGEAQVERERAERALEAGRPAAAGEALARGLARVERALAINPQEARGLALKGSLLALRLRLEADPGRRAENAAAAASAFAEALRRNPLLRREVAPYLAEVAKTAPRS